MTNETLNPQPSTALADHSLSPAGEQFAIPQNDDYRGEFERIEQLVHKARTEGKEIVVRKLTEMGAEMRVHDPYVDHWYELEKQDVYPSEELSWKRFFRNQDVLQDIQVQRDLPKALTGVEALILAVPHKTYLDLSPDDVVTWAGNPLAVVDCFGILSDDTIRRYFELGCEVKALGRGHVQAIKKAVQKKR